MDILNLVEIITTSEVSILKLTLGAIFGLCLGLTGVGGGVLLIPMLQIFCSMSPVLAVGTASLIAAMVKINASIAHVRAKNVSWKQVQMLFVGAVPVTIGVTQLVIYFNSNSAYREITQSVISVLVTTVMVGSLFAVVQKFRSQPAEGVAQEDSTLEIPKKKAIVSGMFCGSVLGSTGVGGGVLLLPILNTLLNVDIKKAIGSSVVLALCLSMVTAIGYAKGGQADMETAIWFVLGSFAGVAASSKLMRLLSERLVYIITIAVISVSLLMYLFG